jgi:hypothetical protein
VEIPITCALENLVARSQLDEWRRILGRIVISVERTAPSVLRLRLLNRVDELAGLASLAQREMACCPFFDFTFEIETDSIVLVIDVPDDAAGVLDDFVTLSTH